MTELGALWKIQVFTNDVGFYHSPGTGAVKWLPEAGTPISPEPRHISSNSASYTPAREWVSHYFPHYFPHGLVT